MGESTDDRCNDMQRIETEAERVGRAKQKWLLFGGEDAVQLIQIRRLGKNDEQRTTQCLVQWRCTLKEVSRCHGDLGGFLVAVWVYRLSGVPSLGCQDDERGELTLGGARSRWAKIARARCDRYHILVSQRSTSKGLCSSCVDT